MLRGEKNIVVLALSALGDLILTLPLLAEVRRRYPGCRVTVACLRPATAALAHDLGVADMVVALPPHARRSPLGLTGALARLRGLPADIVLQTFSSHGAFGNLLAGAVRAPVRCGFADGRFQCLLTHRVPVDARKHRVTLNLDLLRRLGHWDVSEPTGRVLPPIEAQARRFPPGAARAAFGDYVAVSVGSDPALAFKRWPTQQWADLCRHLAGDGLACVFVGARAERAEIAEVIRMAGGQGMNLAGETGFADLAAVIGESRLVVATDGMLLHLASAMDMPTVGIFGPTHPEIGGPWGDNHARVRLGLPCSPCYGSRTVGRSRPCATRECLQHLPVDMVYRAVRSRVAENGWIVLL